MSGMLSSDQISNLFNGQELPNDSEQPKRRHATVREIDFTRPIKFASDQQRQIELAHDGFARRASTRLSLEMRTATVFEVIAASQSVWSVALEELPPDVMIAVASSTPTGKQILIATETPFVMHMIDRLLGGFAKTGSELYDSSNRSLTAIDLALAGRLFDGIVDQLTETWMDLGGVGFSLVSVEPQVSNVIALALVNEPVLTITLRATVAEIDSTITLILPYEAIVPVDQRLKNRFERDHSDDGSPALATRVSTVDVEMTAELFSFQLPVADARLLKVGARIPLGHPPEEVGVFAEGVRVYRAQPRQQDGQFLVQIIAPEEQE